MGCIEFSSECGKIGERGERIIQNRKAGSNGPYDYNAILEIAASVKRISLPPATILRFFDHIIDMSKPEYKKCANDLGCLRFMTCEMFDYFYGFYKRGGEANGWKNIESTFSNDEPLQTIMDDVNRCDLVKKRAGIIQRGIHAHRDADYIASVSILLPQVEGIVWDIGVAKGLVSGEENGKRRTSGTGVWSFPSLVHAIWNAPSPVDRFNDKLTEEYYSTRFRHPCLHGRSLEYFTIEYSTQLVLMIWGVSEEARQYHT